MSAGAPAAPAAPVYVDPLPYPAGVDLYSRATPARPGGDYSFDQMTLLVGGGVPRFGLFTWHAPSLVRAGRPSARAARHPHAPPWLHGRMSIIFASVGRVEVAVDPAAKGRRAGPWPPPPPLFREVCVLPHLCLVCALGGPATHLVWDTRAQGVAFRGYCSCKQVWGLDVVVWWGCRGLGPPKGFRPRGLAVPARASLST
jgi:hypothetical protein